MAKNSVADWSATAADNTDIGGTSIQGTANVSNFDDAFRTLMAQAKVGFQPIYTIYTETTGVSLLTIPNLGGFDQVVIEGTVRPISGTQTLAMRLSGYTAADYYAQHAFGTGAGGLIDGSELTGTYFRFLPGGATSTTNYAPFVRISLSGFNKADRWTRGKVEAVYNNGTANLITLGHLQMQRNAAETSVSFFEATSAVNIVYELRVWGNG